MNRKIARNDVVWNKFAYLCNVVSRHFNTFCRFGKIVFFPTSFYSNRNDDSGPYVAIVSICIKVQNMKLSESFLQTPLAELSVKDFVSLMSEYKRGGEATSEKLFDEDAWISGYKSLAKYLHCSVPTVCRLVKSGKIDPAIRKIGATYWFDKKIIRDLMKVWWLGNSFLA